MCFFEARGGFYIPPLKAVGFETPTPPFYNSLGIGEVHEKAHEGVSWALSVSWLYAS